MKDFKMYLGLAILAVKSKQFLAVVLTVITLCIIANGVKAESVEPPVEEPTTYATTAAVTTTAHVEVITTTTAEIIIEPIKLLSEAEREVVENIVMGEAEGESYEGKILVAQCILNACLKDDIEPSDVRNKYKYSGWNENPSEDVKNAVTAVFDEGYTVTDEPILYFYAPKICNSKWHETQRYILTEGGHKFFAEWEA